VAGVFLIQAILGSLADIEGAQAIAERGEDAARHVASGVAEAAEGASAMALREAAATSARVNLRNMIVLLKCAP